MRKERDREKQTKRKGNREREREVEREIARRENREGEREGETRLNMSVLSRLSRRLPLNIFRRLIPAHWGPLRPNPLLVETKPAPRTSEPR